MEKKRWKSCAKAFFESYLFYHFESIEHRQSRKLTSKHVLDKFHSDGQFTLELIKVLLALSKPRATCAQVWTTGSSGNTISTLKKTSKELFRSRFSIFQLFSKCFHFQSGEENSLYSGRHLRRLEVHVDF